MSQIHEIAVPDVGDKGALSVAEILVRPGDLVWADDPLVTVESGKAVVDVAAPVDGTITEIRVACGDTVFPGRVVVVMTASQEQRPKRQRRIPLLLLRHASFPCLRPLPPHPWPKRRRRNSRASCWYWRRAGRVLRRVSRR